MSDRIASRPGWKTDRVERFVALARGVVAVERVWPALWPASGLIGLWLAAGLFGAFLLLPGWLHLLLLLGFLSAVAGLLWWQFEGFSWPHWRDGARRLEQDSTLAHRPISERDDVLAAGRGDPYAEALWRAHVRRLLARIRNLRVALPHSRLAEKDPHALRFAVLLLLLAGFAVAGHDWAARLGSAFAPDFGPAGSAATLDAWINPPAYTGEAPIYLAAGQDSVRAPAGSHLVVRVHGAGAAPRLDVENGAGRAPAFKRLNAGSQSEFAGGMVLTSSGSLAVIADGHRLGRWHVQVVPDEPPVVAFAEKPSRTERNSVKFAVTAGDDYGIARLSVTLTPLAGTLRTPLTIDLPVDNSHARTLKETVYKDLTAHPYAGAKVSAVLTAIDGAGQRASSKPVTFTLPQHVFTDPLARALVEQRRNLVLGDLAAVPDVLRTLAALTLDPARFYADKPSIYLALRSAYHGLETVRERADLVRVEDLLWQTALALDQHGAAMLAEQLRRLQAMLSQALASGASQDQIQQLLQRYNQVLQQYLTMMAQNAPQGAQGPVPPNAKVVTPQDLADMMKAIEQLAQTGDRDKAAQMLAMLQSLIENMHMEAGGQGNGQGQSPQDKAANEALGKLGDLMGQQRELLDKTYRQSQGEGKPGDGKALAPKQGDLKKSLEGILKGLGAGGGKAPQSLKDAGRAMGEAQGELGQQDYATAGEAQKQALEALRKGVGEIASKMGAGGKGGQQSGSNDPFGRPEGARGAIGNGNVKIPDKSTLERARQILEELRKRAGERGRPQEELDYIDRLLKEFD